MIDNNNVVPMPEPLDKIGERIDAAYARCVHGRREWIEGSLELMQAFADARDRFKNDNVGLNRWLVENGHDHHGKNDRAALINMARDLRTARLVLEETERRSYQLIWEEHKDRFRQRGLPNARNSPDHVINPPETDADPLTSATQPLPDSPPVTENSAIKSARSYPIVNSNDGSPITPSKTILAKTFELSAEDAKTLLSAYPSARQKALSAEIMKLHSNHKMRKRAHDLVRLAINVAKSGSAPGLSKNPVLDARMFWPYLPDVFCKFIDMSGPGLAKHFDRLSMVNAKAAEMLAASPHDRLSEINHIWSHGTERPKPPPKPAIPIPRESKIRHEVKFCGETIWPSDSLKATDDDLKSGWHLVHYWINYLENAQPQKPNEIAVIVAHLIGDIEES